MSTATGIRSQPLMNESDRFSRKLSRSGFAEDRSQGAHNRPGSGSAVAQAWRSELR